jgi:DNA-binding transcriptional MerR regulator
MGTLDEVMNLKNQGYSDQQIISGMRQQGFSPKEINDALGQAQIKTAVSPGIQTGSTLSPGIQTGSTLSPGIQTGSTLSPGIQTGANMSQNYIPGMQQQTSEIGGVTQETDESMQGMQPSIMQSPQQTDVPAPSAGEGLYSPQTQELTSNQAPMPAMGGDYGYDPNMQDYGGYENYTPTTGVDTNTIFEVSEQVFADKIKTIKSKLEELNEFKTIAQTRVEHLSDRLEKIESMIDRLQVTILEKIGSYGSSIEGIKDEMSMMQSSLGKMFSEGKVPARRKSVSKTTKRKTSKK